MTTLNNNYSKLQQNHATLNKDHAKQSNLLQQRTDERNLFKDATASSDINTRIAGNHPEIVSETFVQNKIMDANHIYTAELLALTLIGLTLGFYVSK